jgi:methylated-DNA-[protein]-cysteine S-methyltransferase
MTRPELLVFPSKLGWMAVILVKSRVRQLTFGHPTSAAARAALPPELASKAIVDSPKSPLMVRLQRYASGVPDDFRDVPVDFTDCSRFRRRILTHCRNIGHGATISYAELAQRAGHPGAARAVGNCMAANRVPLIIPCHRVVRTDGTIGSYSAPGGSRTKQQLLRLEAGNWPRIE